MVRFSNRVIWRRLGFQAESLCSPQAMSSPAATQASFDVELSQGNILEDSQKEESAGKAEVCEVSAGDEF